MYENFVYENCIKLLNTKFQIFLNINHQIKMKQLLNIYQIRLLFQNG